MKGYDFARLTASSAELLPKLYKRAFGHNYNTEYVISKFFHPYQKFQCSATALSSVGEAASFYGVIVQRAIIKGETVILAQSCDSMTDPAHGGRGLFLDLAERVYDCLRKSQIEIVFGFPNERIFGLRQKKLGWITAAQINCYQVRVFTIPVAAAASKLTAFRSLGRGLTRAIFKKYRSVDAFFPSSAVSADHGGIVHDIEYFNYKGGPSKHILKIHGINFWIKVDGLMWIGDFENCSADTFSKCLSTLRRLAFLIGCRKILFHFQEKTPNDMLLAAYVPVSGTLPLAFRWLNDSNSPFPIRIVAADFDTW
jgi:hypothetical protein